MDSTRLIEAFKWLHRHPELGLQERQTTDYLTRILREHDVRLLDTGMDTGAIAVVGGAKPGPVVALRCDIDALPICEASGLPYTSEHEGVMHACGHDFHAATMLGAALMLKAREAELPGKVKIIFQPAEEIDGGAKRMVDTGLLDDVQAFFAVHSYPQFQPGELGIRKGPVMAAADRFALRIRGKGCHAGHPDQGVDPVPAMASVIQAMQAIVSRTVNPFDSAVVSVTHVQAGNTWNVVPEEAFLEGTVRTMTHETRAAVRQRLERAARSAAEAHGCTTELEYECGSAPVINDAQLCERAAAVGERLGFRVKEQAGVMGAEDFSDYLALAPGVFIRVGTGGEYDAHHPKFTVDPEALYPAAEFFAALAVAELEYLAGKD